MLLEHLDEQVDDLLGHGLVKGGSHADHNHLDQSTKRDLHLIYRGDALWWVADGSVELRQDHVQHVRERSI